MAFAPGSSVVGGFSFVGLNGVGAEPNASYAEGVREATANRYARSAGIEDWEAALAAWRRVLPRRTSAAPEATGDRQAKCLR